MAGALDAAIGIGASVTTLVGTWLAYKGKLVEKLTQPAQAQAEKAATAAQQADTSASKADMTALAFASGFADLFGRMEVLKEEVVDLRAELVECRKETAEARATAREARAAEEQRTREQQRLEGILEGVLNERSR